MQVLNSLDQQKNNGSVGQLPEFCGSTTDGPTTAHRAEMHARGRKELQKMICYQQITGLQTFARVAFLLVWNVFSLTAHHFWHAANHAKQAVRHRVSRFRFPGRDGSSAAQSPVPESTSPVPVLFFSRDRKGIVCATTCVRHWCTILRDKEWG